MKKFQLTPPDRRGMTLVEMMISLTIFAVIMGVVFGFLQNSSESYQKTREKVQYQQSLRAVMSLISREVRSAGCDPSGAGFDRFAQADATVLQCRMDLNGDGDVTDITPDEDITYTFNAGSGELSRVGGGNNLVILNGLQNLSFAYFDGNGAPLNSLPLNALDRAMVRFVDLTMVGETDEGEPVSLTTRVSLRNG